MTDKKSQQKEDIDTLVRAVCGMLRDFNMDDYERKRLARNYAEDILEAAGIKQNIADAVADGIAIARCRERSDYFN